MKPLAALVAVLALVVVVFVACTSGSSYDTGGSNSDGLCKVFAADIRDAGGMSAAEQLVGSDRFTIVNNTSAYTRISEVPDVTRSAALLVPAYEKNTAGWSDALHELQSTCDRYRT